MGAAQGRRGREHDEGGSRHGDPITVVGLYRDALAGVRSASGHNRGYDASNRGDIPAVTEAMTPDIEWNEPGGAWGG